MLNKLEKAEMQRRELAEVVKSQKKEIHKLKAENRNMLKKYSVANTQSTIEVPSRRASSRTSMKPPDGLKSVDKKSTTSKQKRRNLSKTDLNQKTLSKLVNIQNLHFGMRTQDNRVSFKELPRGKEYNT